MIDYTEHHYLCLMCGYIYDPELGDPTQNECPNTAFDALPESWVCPLCYVDKTYFERLTQSDLEVLEKKFPIDIEQI